MCSSCIVGKHMTYSSLSPHSQAEQTSIAQLQALLFRVIEGISFVLLLIDYKFSETVALYVPIPTHFFSGFVLTWTK